MIVYRVEHCQTGEGPYTQLDPSWEMWKLISAHNKPKQWDERPGPVRDFPSGMQYPVGIAGREYFAFPNVEAMKWWFRGYRSLLRRNGFVLREYVVPDEAVVMSNSGKQCVFRKSAAVRVAERPVV